MSSVPSSLAGIIETHMAYDRGRAEDVSWAWLVTLHSDQEKFASLYPDTSFKNVLNFYMADLNNPGSVRFTLRAARENARALRATIPIENVGPAERILQSLPGHTGRPTSIHPAVSYMQPDQVRLLWATGCCGQHSLSCRGWRFFQLGLMIERADQTSRLLDVKFAQLITHTPRVNQVTDAVFWALILRSAAAYQAYHRFEQRDPIPTVWQGSC